MASQAKNTAADWGRSAASDSGQQPAIGCRRLGKHRVRASGPRPGNGKVNEFATKTADKIEKTARYLREHDTNDMVAGMESMVRRNPGASLCAALAVGFLIGTAIKRDRDY